MSGITKTIPVSGGEAMFESLFDGSIQEYEFHMAGKPSKLNVGDYVYTIYKDLLRGRMKISRIVSGAEHPESGRTRTLIYVEAPGDRLDEPYSRKGHRGTRYYDGAEWPK